mmetsp:Transcript_40420/g.56315  ORF Transcript_40420/g.56315 Transcript_40420/m.56315 type:complete len:81 (+) Transcript_40420:134-376(+)
MEERSRLLIGLNLEPCRGLRRLNNHYVVEGFAPTVGNAALAAAPTRPAQPTVRTEDARERPADEAADLSARETEMPDSVK